MFSGYLPWISSHGCGCNCFNPRDTRLLRSSKSITATFKRWSNWTISLGLSTRPQERSVMWRRPSTPPRSMNTPKSVMFLTAPSRTWPASIVSRICSLCSSRSLSISARWDTTTFSAAMFNLTTANSMVLPTYASKSRTGRTSICEPGKKASIPNRSTTIPPLMRRLIRPSTTSPVSCAPSIFSHASRMSALRRDRINWPSLSSTRSRKTSTSSPGAMFSSDLFENSFTAIIPSDLNPMSITTYFSSIDTIRPVTISFSSMVFNVFSYIPINWLYSSAEYSSDGLSNWSKVYTSPSTSPLNTCVSASSLTSAAASAAVSSAEVDSSETGVSWVSSTTTSSVVASCSMVSFLSSDIITIC